MLIRYLKRLDAALRMAEIRLNRGRNDLAQASLDVAENYLNLLESSFSDDLYIKDTKNKMFVNYLSQAKAKYEYLVDSCASIERSDSPEKLLADALNFSESQRQLGLDRYCFFSSQGTEKVKTEKTAESQHRLSTDRYRFLSQKAEENPGAAASDASNQFSLFS
ncbi:MULTISPECIES: hypothetical protein [unclassified Legionella]|uniref:hypothetical protein n=1 Tax=unclassified Legionella TaxID=2622702 RepID=UPI001E3B18D4|nr:hypothetical protein [Legionella sp. 31fI33]MCC5014034.1 hypothetical protein [Legionella sp. 31fI33]